MPYRNQIATKSCIEPICNPADFFANRAGLPHGGLNPFFTMPIESLRRGAVAGAVNRSADHG
jgi:hypothetical protein